MSQSETSSPAELRKGKVRRLERKARRTEKKLQRQATRQEKRETRRWNRLAKSGEASVLDLWQGETGGAQLGQREDAGIAHNGGKVESPNPHASEGTRTEEWQAVERSSEDEIEEYPPVNPEHPLVDEDPPVVNEELIGRLEQMERRLLDQAASREQSREEALRRLRELDGRAQETEAYAERAERLADLASQSTKDEAEFRELLDQLGAAQKRAEAAEQRFRSALERIPRPTGKPAETSAE